MQKRLFLLFTDEFDLLTLHIIGTFYVMLLLCTTSSGNLGIERFRVLNSMFISFVSSHVFICSDCEYLHYKLLSD